MTVLALMACLAQGGPPLLTNAPGAPGDGRWEINLAVTAEKAEGRNSYQVPDVDVNYGVGERLQLTAEMPWLLVDTEGSELRAGLDRASTGFKWRFLDEE